MIKRRVVSHGAIPAFIFLQCGLAVAAANTQGGSTVKELSMKKQRVFSLLLVCLLAFGLSFALLSCTINLPGDDSGTTGGGGSTGGTGGGSTSNVVGTWVGYSGGVEWRLVFSSNGNVTQYGDGEYAGTGSWTATGSNTIRVTMGEDTISGTINGNTMYLAGVTLTKR